MLKLQTSGAIKTQKRNLIMKTNYSKNIQNMINGINNMLADYISLKISVNNQI